MPIPKCDGRVRKVPTGISYGCITQTQVNKLPKNLITGLIKYRASKKASYNKNKKK